MKDFGQIEQTGEAMLIYEVSDEAIEDAEGSVKEKVGHSHSFSAPASTLVHREGHTMPQSEFGVGNKVANHEIKARKATELGSQTGGAMRKTPLLVAAILAASISGVPEFAAAIGTNNPTPPQSNQPSGTTTTKHKSKKDKSSSAKDFLDRYHAAYALIYDKGDFEGGITALRAMSYDGNADVATLLGYASRKLGRYDDAKYWYDKALAADPNHALTWSYYGMWHAEQGNLLKAKDDLEKVRLICGTECKEYIALKEVIDGTRTY